MATLNKFGVPLGADGQEGRLGILQPKLRYRYRVRTVNFGPSTDQINLTQQVISVSKPQVTTEQVLIDLYNSKAWVAGKHEWQPLTLTVRDDITNAVSSLVGYQMQKQVNHFEQTAPAAGVNYKFNMIIEVMDGGNVVVQERWDLEGCWLVDVNWNELDYAASESQSITMSVRFDNATQSGGLFPTAPVITNPGGTFVAQN